MTYLNLDNWNRKPHFDFFKDFDEPFFGINVEVDVTRAYERARELGVSFFLYYLHLSMTAANKVENFRYRIRGEQVVVHESVAASATIGRPDHTFGFSFIPYHEDLGTFVQMSQREIKRVLETDGLMSPVNGDEAIHYSSVPWLRFTSLTHARDYKKQDSCPKISFGKILLKNGNRTMPMSIFGHHALMDGWHVGQYVERFEDALML